MQCKKSLPEDYKEIFSVHLQKDKKIAIVINALAIIIAGALFVLAHFFVVPIRSLFDMSLGIGSYFLRFAVLLVGMILYMILHEAVHGITMKCFGAQKIQYGFTGLYAYAGCNEYFKKGSYIVIALAPVVIWGVVLAVVCCFVSPTWFWVAYMIQIMNLSGAAGDFYVTARFCRFPSDILVQDTGVSMTVYSK